MTEKFTITIHMVASLDGFIAKNDNSISWFDTMDTYDKGIEPTEEERINFLKNIDCYVMGARTYEHALELSKNYGWPYGDVPTIVLTNKPLAVERSSIEFFSGDLLQLVNEQLKPKYKNVWVVGGATLAGNFINQQIADEIRITILPILLGEGLPFFNELKSEQALHLENVSAYKNGMVELLYHIRKK